MITKGLTDEEIGQLAAAGFAPGVVEAVAREALTMRWLFLRRGLPGFWAGTAGILIVIGAYFASWRFGDFGWLIGLVVSVLPFVQYAPHLEAWSQKRSDPVRYAARRLAIMAVIAQRNPKLETNAPMRELHNLPERLDPLAHPHTQLRLIARAMDDDALSEREARKTVASSDGVRATLVFGLVVLAVVVIIVTLALGARPF